MWVLWFALGLMVAFNIYVLVSFRRILKVIFAMMADVELRVTRFEARINGTEEKT